MFLNILNSCVLRWVQQCHDFSYWENVSHQDCSLLPISVTQAINKPNNFTKEKSSFCPPTVVVIENKAAKTSCTFSSEPIPCQKHIRCQPWILQCLNEFVHYECRRGSVNAHWSRIHHQRNTLRTIRPFSRSVGIKSLPLSLSSISNCSSKVLKRECRNRSSSTGFVSSCVMRELQMLDAYTGV